MGIFKKKSKREDAEFEDEESTEKRTKRLPKSKDFKDLKPENKRVRKEPKKPWGKIERAIIILLILMTAGTSAVLSIASYGWKIPGLPRFASNFTFPLFGEEEIILEGDPALQKKTRSTLNSLKTLTRDYSGIYGVYVTDLTTGVSYGHYETEEFQAASLIKLPVMAAVFLEVEKGTFTLNDIYRLVEADKRSGAGSLASRPVGTKLTYRELVELMGKESDNTAFSAMRRILGERTIEETMNNFGMTRTSVDENLTTPRDIGRFFKTLWSGGVISDEHRDELLSYLTDTSYEEWLPKGVPSTIKVSHKFGREVHVVNDAGIVFTTNPYVVVILSKGIVEKEADVALPAISEIIFEGHATEID